LHSSTLQRLEPGIPLQTLRGQVRVQKLTLNIFSITAQGKTAAVAEGAANAVARSYITFVSHTKARGLQAQPQQIGGRATVAVGTSLITEVLTTSGLGALVGAIGAIALSGPGR